MTQMGKNPFEILRGCVASCQKRMIKYYGSEENYIAACKNLGDAMDEINNSFAINLIDAIDNL